MSTRVNNAWSLRDALVAILIVGYGVFSLIIQFMDVDEKISLPMWAKLLLVPGEVIGIMLFIGIVSWILGLGDKLLRTIFGRNSK